MNKIIFFSIYVNLPFNFFNFIFLQELERATKMAEQNSKKLKTESDRLEELTNRTCSWAIWIMLAIVCAVFINMIIFIKFFPKKRR